MGKDGTVWLVYNSASGGSDAAMLGRIMLALAGRGLGATRAIDLQDGAVPDIAALHAAGVSLLAIHAGDGSSNAVVSAVQGWDGEVLVLPGGTANLLARELHGDAPADVIAALVGTPALKAVRRNCIRCGAGTGLIEILAGPGAAWSDVREELREGALADVAAKTVEAARQSTGGPMVRLVEPELGRGDGYAGVRIVPNAGGLVVSGYGAQTIGDYFRQGVALIKRDFRQGPHDELGEHAAVTCRSSDDAPIALMIDGERADGGAVETFSLAPLAVNLLAESMAEPITIFHLSDIHFGLADARALAWAKDCIARERPAAVAITGDLTMRARHREFRAATEWISALGPPVTVEVGNHDMPYFNLVERFTDPYRRFRAIETLVEREIDLPGLAIVPLKTATRAQWRFPWSNGWVTERALSQALAAIDALPAGTRVLVTAHHPLTERDAHGKRLTIAGGRAMEALAERRILAILSGHVHDAFDIDQPTPAGNLRMIGAGTLSQRIRSSPPSFNQLTISGDAITVKVRNLEDVPTPAMQIAQVPENALPPRQPEDPVAPVGTVPVKDPAGALSYQRIPSVRGLATIGRS